MTLIAHDADGSEKAAFAATPAEARGTRRAPRTTVRSATTTDAAVGQRIRSLRVAAGRSQRDLAQQLGITTAQMHRYEVGVTRVAASRLVAIAAALGVRPNELIGGGAPGDTPEVNAEEQALLSAFSSISSPRHRSALLQVARSMASASQAEGESED